MGRKEKPVDPREGPVARFALALRELRREAGSPPYRAMAQGVGYSVSALSRAAGGETLPSLPLVLAYVRACGGDAVEWEHRWREAQRMEAAQALALEEETVDPPYRGLARFETCDSARFFGREALTEALLRLVGAHRCVMVFGPSGSGKSSLLRAGLIPRLRNTVEPRPAAIRVLTPGPRPAHDHEKLFEPAAGPGETWLIVDQFEGLFTLCADPRRRARFLESLATVREPGSRLRAVLGVRADFLARCLTHPLLTAVAQEASLLIGPMAPAELREVIVKPAAAQGLIVERALTARLIEETGSEPGGLPLLSHALLETWRRRHGRTLTLAGYEAAGGIHGAIAQTAEDLYHSLSHEQAAHARRILLRLITPGEGAPDTRRPVDRGELDTNDPVDTEPVLERLARSRLITLDDNLVDLAHEALITSWPRLRGWVEEDRERLVAHRRLTEAAALWEELGRDAGALYRGSRLNTAERQFGEPRGRDDLTAAERDFLAASIEERDRERRAVARRDRHVRYLAAGLAVLLAVVTSVGALAIRQRQEADRARLQATSRQLAAQALALAPTRPTVAKLLGVEAFRTAATPEARGALLTMSTHQYHQAELTGHGDAVSEVAFSPDGLLASVGRDRKIMLWDPWHRTLLATLTGHDTWLRTVAFSSDGAMMATGGDDKKVALWDMATRKRTATLSGHTELVTSLAFAPDGRTLATASADRAVALWDPRDRTRRHTLTGHPDTVGAVAFSPDGRTLATAAGRTVTLWDTATGTRGTVLEGHRGTVKALGFSPDGRILATAGEDHEAMLWDAGSGARTATLTGHTGEIRALAFSPDGRTLATAGLDRTVMLWDPARAVHTATLTGHGTNVYGLAFSPGPSPLLASTGENGAVTLWDPSRIAMTGHTDRVNKVAFSPDGTTLATASDDGTAALWNRRLGTRTATIDAGSGQVNSVAFSPDGRTIATATGVAVHPPRARDYALTLWRAAARAVPKDAAGKSSDAHVDALAKLTGHTDRVTDVAFSPDGRTAATAGADGAVILWDTARKARLATLGPPALSGATTAPAAEEAAGVHAVAFSPDGRTLASAGHQGTTVVWDVAGRTRRLTLSGHTASLRAVAFSPDGRTLATAGLDRRVILWDAARGTRKATLTGDSSALAVAFSPDSATLATAGADTSVDLWRTDTRRHLATLTGHTRQVRALAFSPDGATLATGAVDGRVVLWNTDTERTAEQLCATVARSLTRQEWARFAPESPFRRTCP
ncbi:nSTAND1 domain-containing NTPase [Streptomyces sp. URMC 123]|uniref:nSTAND1 domain-containing NTPase n=1 Tax=Streptomyces sp. URMC 123 TaxID=3423403 RepID=UPI003F1DEF0C